LLADAPAVRVFCETYEGHWDIGVESHLKLSIHFQNDILFVIEQSHLARKIKPRWYVLGDQGALIKHGLDPQEKAMVAGHIETAQEDPKHRAQVYTAIDGMETEMTVDTVRGDWKAFYRNIADVLLRGAELAVRPEEVRKDMEIIDAAMESAQTGSAVHLS
jgi:predicted dehydrogenase